MASVQLFSEKRDILFVCKETLSSSAEQTILPVEDGGMCREAERGISVNRVEYVRHSDRSPGLDNFSPSQQVLYEGDKVSLHTEILCYWVPQALSRGTYLCVLRFLSLLIWLGAALRILCTQVSESTYL
jgi:hypothetical protein